MIRRPENRIGNNKNAHINFLSIYFYRSTQKVVDVHRPITLLILCSAPHMVQSILYAAAAHILRIPSRNRIRSVDAKSTASESHTNRCLNWVTHVPLQMTKFIFHFPSAPFDGVHLMWRCLAWSVGWVPRVLSFTPCTTSQLHTDAHTHHHRCFKTNYLCMQITSSSYSISALIYSSLVFV